MSILTTSTLLDLPREILFEIAGWLCTPDLNRFFRTSRALHDLLFSDLCKRSLKFMNDHFISYADHGYEVGVRTMLSVGVEVDTRTLNAPFYTALMCAVGNNHIGTAKILLDHGANPNHRDEFRDLPLQWASPFKENFAIQELLLEYKADVGLAGVRGRTPLIDAIYRKADRYISFLLSKGADINAREPESGAPLHIASEKYYVRKDIFDVILGAGAQVDCFDRENMSPLHIAAFYLGIDRISALLTHGADINLRSPGGADSGCTALHYAASTPESYASEAIAFVIQHGADVDAKDDKGRTPFLLVRLESDSTCTYSRVETLLQHGADIKIQDHEGWSALHYQADSMSIELIKWLYDHGCDVNRENKNKETPLFMAISSQNYRNRSAVMVETLLHLGANVNLENSQKRSPLFFAATRGCPKMTRILLEHGADVHHRDRRGFTPLHLAVTTVAFLCNDKLLRPRPTVKEIHEVIRLLVQYGGDIKAEDHHGFTPSMLTQHHDLRTIGGR
ncbi:hypothetical protein N7478_011904 [Penicillium angulare]|uniref:uncharacterized protein n=1 Tax=Penicillium angulare TaxID=116970 RepID=UPI0025410042|nr:uncharacterized protein N7478_011904 [Penicillium angulare]KAJ5261309.1 hypothetical protein N7478_011904 [Penicillium angulare]